MPDVLNLLPHAAAAPHANILYGQVSTKQPAPTSFTQPLYVTIPDWSTDLYWTVTNWPAVHGNTLPAQGAACHLEFDNQRNLRVTWWDGTTTPPVGDTSTDPTSPIAQPASPRNRALRDFYSVLDFGTYTSGDMTSTFATAMTWAAAKGTANGTPFKLEVPPNVYLLQHMQPPSYVDLWCYGAQLKRNLAGDTSNLPIFYCNPTIGIGTAVTQFAIRGATFHGTGTETSFQGFYLVGRSTYLTVEDCLVDNCTGNGIYFLDCQNMWVRRNKLNAVTAAGGTNPINFVSGSGGSALPLKYIWCEENLVTACPTIGIAVVSSGSNRTDPVVDAHINDNTCEVTGVGWPIGIEQTGTGAPPNVKRIDISGNTCIQAGTGGNTNPAIALTNDSSTPSGDALCISGVTVTGNRIVSNGRGILCEASRAAITGNQLEVATDDIVLAGPGSPGSTVSINYVTVVGNVGHLGSGLMVKSLDGVGTNIVQAGNTA